MDWKYIKRNKSTISIVDLKLIYLRENGKYPTYNSEYIKWLEDRLTKKMEIQQKLIPFENK